MINIVLISRDERVIRLMSEAQSFFKARLSVVSDSDLGLKEVFENRPSAVFIQEQTAGISEGKIAQHIKTLLGKNAPALVLLGNDSGKVLDLKGHFDGAVSLTLPDHELVTALQQQMEKIVFIQWKKTSGEVKEAQLGQKTDRRAPGTAGSVSAESSIPQGSGKPLGKAVLVEHEEMPVSPLPISVEEGSGIVPSAVTRQDTKTAIRPTASNQQSELSGEQEPVSVEGVAFPDVSKSRVKGSSSPDNGPIHGPVPTALPSSPFARAGDADNHTELQSMATLPTADTRKRMVVATPEVVEEDPFEWPPLPEKFEVRVRSRSRYWLYLLGAALLLSLLIFSRYGGTIRKWFGSFRHTTTTDQADQLTKTQHGKVLPQFIPESGIDREYAQHHPGWERYRSDTIEYLVFREKGLIKALQIIALQQNALAESYIDSSLAEICPSATYTIRSEVERGGFVTRLGTLSCGQEIALYVKKGTKEIRGVVVTFP